jgi:hypothetical protein
MTGEDKKSIPPYIFNFSALLTQKKTEYKSKYLSFIQDNPCPESELEINLGEEDI